MNEIERKVDELLGLNTKKSKKKKIVNIFGRVMPLSTFIMITTSLIVGAIVITQLYGTYLISIDGSFEIHGLEQPTTGLFYDSVEIENIGETIITTMDVTNISGVGGYDELFSHTWECTDINRNYKITYDDSAIQNLIGSDPNGVWFGFDFLVEQSGSPITEITVNGGAGVSTVDHHYIVDPEFMEPDEGEQPFVFVLGMTIEELLFLWTQHYKLDGNATEEVFGADGTVYGGVTWVSGRVDQCADFDGTDAYIELPSSVGNFSVSDDFTLAFWVNADSIDTGTAILGKYGGTGYYLEFVDSKLNFCFKQSGGTSFWTRGQTVLTTGTWHHIITTWDGTDQKIYINGAEESYDKLGSITGDIITTANLRLGSYSSIRLDGRLDSVKIFDGIALDDAQVLELYESYP